MTSHFEARLHGFRRTQDGIVVSYLVHNEDLSQELALAKLGTRYMVAFSAIGDDEKPIPSPPENGQPTPAKERKPFDSLPLSQQAALRCNDEQFKWFLMDRYPSVGQFNKDAASVVRQICNVTSRAEFDHGGGGADVWVDLEKRFQLWLTDKRYADSAR